MLKVIYPNKKVEAEEDDLLEYKKEDDLPEYKKYDAQLVLEKIDQQRYMVSSEVERVNFLLLSVIKEIIPNEFKKFKSLDEVDLLSDQCLIGKLFKYIFKSQNTNVDSISCFVAHILNSMMTDISSEH